MVRPLQDRESRGSSSSRRSTGKSGLNIIGILTEDTVAKAKPFAAEWKMNYTLLSGIDRDDVDDAYGPMFGLPVTIVDFPRRQNLQQARRPVVEGRHVMEPSRRRGRLKG